MGKTVSLSIDSSLTDVLRSRLQIEYDLREAIEKEEFELYYQPQVNLNDGQITGLEALIRWNHPTKGLLSPVEFIPIAEQTRMIVSLGEWILHTACKQAQNWQDTGLFDGLISVNISAVQLEFSNLPEVIEDALQTSKLSPEKLVLEITETAIMSNPKRLVKLFSGLRKQGVRFSIDDFGTGYSSLAYLRQLPLDILKIDKSFINDLPYSEDGCIIAEAIISLASKLGLETIAEGVETKEQAKYLINAECSSAQGYLYDKPLDTLSLKQVLTKKKYNID